MAPRKEKKGKKQGVKFSELQNVVIPHISGRKKKAAEVFLAFLFFLQQAKIGGRNKSGKKEKARKIEKKTKEKEKQFQ